MIRALVLLAAGILVVPVVPAPVLARTQPAAEEGSTRTLYLALIRQARLDGKPRAALAYLDDFDRRHPGDREAQVLRVNCHLDLNQIDAADAALARVPASDRSGDALAVRGHVLAAKAHWAGAVEAYGQAQAASPADPFVGNALGYAQLQVGRTREAVETFKRALDLAPGAAHGQTLVRNNLALALTVAGRTDEAAALIARVPDRAERQRLLARLAVEATRLAKEEGGSMPGSR